MTRSSPGWGATLSGYATLTIFGFLLLLSAFISQPSTVLYPRQTGEGDPIRVVLLPIFPQAWPFFTKAPDSPELAAYDPISRQSLSLFPNSAVRNWYGLSRTQRAQGPEMANLSNSVPTSEWVECLAYEGDCLDVAAARPSVKLNNDSSVPTLCGSLVLVVTTPVPWEYRNEYAGWRVDSKAVHVWSDCERPR